MSYLNHFETPKDLKMFRTDYHQQLNGNKFSDYLIRRES